MRLSSTDVGVTYDPSKGRPGRDSDFRLYSLSQQTHPEVDPASGVVLVQGGAVWELVEDCTSRMATTPKSAVVPQPTQSDRRYLAFAFGPDSGVESKMAQM